MTDSASVSAVAAPGADDVVPGAASAAVDDTAQNPSTLLDKNFSHEVQEKVYREVSNRYASASTTIEGVVVTDPAARTAGAVRDAAQHFGIEAAAVMEIWLKVHNQKHPETKKRKRKRNKRKGDFTTCNDSVGAAPDTEGIVTVKEHKDHKSDSAVSFTRDCDGGYKESTCCMELESEECVEATPFNNLAVADHRKVLEATTLQPPASTSSIAASLRVDTSPKAPTTSTLQVVPHNCDGSLSEETRLLVTRALLARCALPKLRLGRDVLNAVSAQLQMEPEVVYRIHARLCSLGVDAAVGTTKPKKRKKRLVKALQKLVLERRRVTKSLTSALPSLLPLSPIGCSDNSTNSTILVAGVDYVPNPSSVVAVDTGFATAIVEDNAAAEVTSHAITASSTDTNAARVPNLCLAPNTGTLMPQERDTSLTPGMREIVANALLDRFAEPHSPSRVDQSTSAPCTTDSERENGDVPCPCPNYQRLTRMGGYLTRESRDIVCNAILDKCHPNGRLASNATQELAEQFQLSATTVHTMWKRILASVAATGSVDPCFRENGSKPWHAELNLEEACSALQPVLARRNSYARASVPSSVVSPAVEVAAQFEQPLTVASDDGLRAAAAPQETLVDTPHCAHVTPRSNEDTVSICHDSPIDTEMSKYAACSSSSDLKSSIERWQIQPTAAASVNGPTTPSVGRDACGGTNLITGNDAKALPTRRDGRPDLESAPTVAAALRSPDDSKQTVVDEALDNSSSDHCANEQPMIPTLLSPIDDVVRFLSFKYIQDCRGDEDVFRADLHVRMMINHVHFLLGPRGTALLRYARKENDNAEVLARLCICDNYDVRNKHCQLFSIHTVDNLADEAVPVRSKVLCSRCDDTRRVIVKKEDTSEDNKRQDSSHEVKREDSIREVNIGDAVGEVNKEDSDDVIPDSVSSLACSSVAKSLPCKRRKLNETGRIQEGDNSQQPVLNGKSKRDVMDDIVMNLDISSVCATPPPCEARRVRAPAVREETSRSPESSRVARPGEMVTYTIAGNDATSTVRKRHLCISPIRNPPQSPNAWKLSSPPPPMTGNRPLHSPICPPSPLQNQDINHSQKNCPTSRRTPIFRRPVGKEKGCSSSLTMRIASRTDSEAANQKSPHYLLDESMQTTPKRKTSTPLFTSAEASTSSDEADVITKTNGIVNLTDDDFIEATTPKRKTRDCDPSLDLATRMANENRDSFMPGSSSRGRPTPVSNRGRRTPTSDCRPLSSMAASLSHRTETPRSSWRNSNHSSWSRTAGSNSNVHPLPGYQPYYPALLHHPSYPHHMSRLPLPYTGMHYPYPVWYPPSHSPYVPLHHQAHPGCSPEPNDDCDASRRNNNSNTPNAAAIAEQRCFDWYDSNADANESIHWTFCPSRGEWFQDSR